MTKPADERTAKAREPWPEYVSANGVGAVSGILNLWIRTFESSPSFEQIAEAAAIIDDLVEHKRSSAIKDAREECARIAEGELLLPLEAWQGTKREHGACVAREIARLIRGER